MNKCEYVNLDGRPCGAHRMKHSEYCFRHDPENAEAKLQASRKGGENRSHVPVEYGTEVALETPMDIRTFLGQVINGVWMGKVPSNAGTAMGFLTRCWLDAHEATKVQDQLDSFEKRLQQAGL